MIDVLLLIGQMDGMRSVSEKASASARTTFEFPDIVTALATASRADLTIVFQHSPDQYPQDDISQILNAGPLSRLIVCLGPWCAGYGRTRQYWPAAVCVDESRWLNRLKKELLVLSGKHPPLPWTAGLDEVFAFDEGRSDPDLTC